MKTTAIKTYIVYFSKFLTRKNTKEHVRKVLLFVFDCLQQTLMNILFLKNELIHLEFIYFLTRLSDLDFKAHKGGQ